MVSARAWLSDGLPGTALCAMSEMPAFVTVLGLPVRVALPSAHVEYCKGLTGLIATQPTKPCYDSIANKVLSQPQVCQVCTCLDLLLAYLWQLHI